MWQTVTSSRWNSAGSEPREQIGHSCAPRPEGASSATSGHWETTRPAKEPAGSSAKVKAPVANLDNSGTLQLEDDENLNSRRQTPANKARRNNPDNPPGMPTAEAQSDRVNS